MTGAIQIKQGVSPYSTIDHVDLRGAAANAALLPSCHLHRQAGTVMVMGTQQSTKLCSDGDSDNNGNRDGYSSGKDNNDNNNNKNNNDDDVAGGFGSNIDTVVPVSTQQSTKNHSNGHSNNGSNKQRQRQRRHKHSIHCLNGRSSIDTMKSLSTAAQILKPLRIPSNIRSL